MKGKQLRIRAYTEPVVQKLYERSFKAQGIIYVQYDKNSNRKSTILEVKPDNKLLFHCYKRYKTFSYNLDKVYQDNQNDYSDIYDDSFQKSNALNFIKIGANYMMYATGFCKSAKELSPVRSLFFDQLFEVHQNLIKSGSHFWNISALAISEECNLRSLQIREIIDNRTPNISDFYLVDCSYTSPETPLQIKQFIKDSYQKKLKLLNKSHFIIYVQICSKAKKQLKQKILLVDCTKGLDIEDKNWDNGSSLVLNKCLLGILNKMENNKQSYMPFRDSKITRILKPFLTSDSKIDAVGFVNPQDQQNPFSTLNLIKNISKIKVPFRRPLQIQLQSSQNPERSGSRTQKKYQLRDSERGHEKIVQQVYSSKESSKIKKLPSSPQQVKILSNSEVFFEEMRKNAFQELQSNKKLQKVRMQINLIKKKKQLSLSHVIQDDVTNDEALQRQQLDHVLKKESELVQMTDKINKKRIETIQKSISKVQKLKMLKEYYTVAIQSQKQEIEQYRKNQQALAKFYEERLMKIQKNLKKSPKQLIGMKETKVNEKSSNNKRYESNDKIQKQRLPYISSKANKRVAYVKQKVKKGRVEYQDFLTKNVSQYQSYLSQYTED